MPDYNEPSAPRIFEEFSPSGIPSAEVAAGVHSTRERRSSGTLPRIISNRKVTR